MPAGNAAEDARMTITARRLAAIAALAGLAWTVVLVGAKPLDPRETDWLFSHRDLAQQYLGWAAFRNDSHWHLPLGATDQLGWPQRTPIALLASIAPVAVALAPLSAWLPRPFQYLGLWLWLSFALAFFVGFRLHARLAPGQPAASLLAAAILMAAPAAAFRANLCPALSAHWIVLAALGLYFAPHAAPLRQAALGFVAAGVSPYFIPPVVLVALGGALARRAARGALSCLAGVALGLASFGLLAGGSVADYAQAGYRLYSFNLVGFVNPMRWAGVLPGLRTFPEQYEGYAYLGVGVLLLLPLGLARLGRAGVRRTLSRHAYLAGAALSCLLLAASPRLTFGPRVLVDLPMPELVERGLSVYRISGPLIWLPHHLIMLFPLAVVARRSARATLWLAAALALQVADFHPRAAAMRALVSAPAPRDLPSADWRALGHTHRRLLVVPAYQCGDSPGGARGFELFGRLAADQRLATNSVHLGRVSESARKEQCGRQPAALAEGRLDPEAAYVLDAQRLWDVAGTTSHACRRLDGFYLCTRAAAPAPIAPLEIDPIPALAPGHALVVRGAGWSDLMLRAGWTGAGEGLVWNHGVSRLLLRLPEGSRGVVRLKLSALTDGGRQPFRILERDGRELASGVAAGASAIIAFSVDVAPAPDASGLVEMELRAERPTRPLDQGLGPDARTLGLALRTVTLLPPPG
jgi:hypothetical protein